MVVDNAAQLNTKKKERDELVEAREHLELDVKEAIKDIEEDARPEINEVQGKINKLNNEIFRLEYQYKQEQFNEEVLKRAYKVYRGGVDCGSGECDGSHGQSFYIVWPTLEIKNCTCIELPDYGQMVITNEDYPVHNAEHPRLYKESSLEALLRAVHAHGKKSVLTEVKP